MNFEKALSALILLSCGCAAEGSNAASSATGGGSGGAAGAPGTGGGAAVSSVSAGGSAGSSGTAIYVIGQDVSGSVGRLQLLRFLPAGDLAHPTLVGDIQCPETSYFPDLAVGSDGEIYSLSYVASTPAILRLIPQPDQVVGCEVLAMLAQDITKEAVSMAPPGTLAAEETLIALHDDGAIFAVSPTSGSVTQVGVLPKIATDSWYQFDLALFASSTSPFGYTVASHQDVPGYDWPPFELVQMDASLLGPPNANVFDENLGEITWGSWCPSPAPSFWYPFLGLAAYEDKIFAFSTDGASSTRVVEVHNQDATGCIVAEIDNFLPEGAGVTTIAPVVPPPR